MTKKTRNRSALFVFVTIALDAMGIGIIIPIMPDLMQELSGEDIGNAALWGGYLAFSYAIMQFLFGPTIGNLSDRYGRRPVLLISLFMLGVDYVVMALAPNLLILFIGRVLSGIAGATHSTATAYIADVTPKEKRAAAFGLVGAGFGVGFVFGPAIGGVIGEFGTRAPFVAAAALAFLNFAYGYFLIPESLPREKRRKFELHRANPMGALYQMRRVPMVGWFVVAMFLYALSHYVYPAVWSYYTKEKFGWANWEIGVSLAAVGIGFALVQGILIRPFLKRFGEKTTAFLGLGFNILGMTGIALVGSGWMLYALMPLTVLGDIVKPALTGLMSNMIPDDAQGELQGIISSAQSISVILSPIMMTQLFGVFTGTDASIYFPGAPFIAAALIMMLTAIPLRIGLSRGK
ncbi:MAG: TCR/Tet family MFS transporter [Pseudomonadota bacterium]